ncbi:MAG: iron-sulfur cluster assembly accessory protein [Caulobacteraceae bacterium]|nr:MAG: iron-sulfur cluster assembly accessory protein [Caulobacteraceae bacterium]
MGVEGSFPQHDRHPRHPQRIRRRPLQIERDGAVALVDDISLGLLKGSEIDFVDELAGAEFRVRNPNAKSSCGCGVSFSL